MRHIVLTANCAWNIVNYRMALVRRLVALGNQVTVLAPADGHEARLIAEGCSFEPIAINGKGLSLVGNALLVARFCSTLKRLRPDILFSFTIKNNIFGSLAARWLGIPYVPNVSGLGTAFFSGPILRRMAIMLYRLAFARLPVAFFQNRDDRALFIAEKIVSADRALLLPGSGIDLVRFAPVGCRRPDGATRFLLIARMLWDKGVGEFVAAAAEVRRDWPDAHFGLLGFLDVANPGAIAKSQMDEWVASGLVEYHGQTDDVRRYIAGADCIVLPTYYGEGTPRTLIEAGAIARPAITSDAPGCREIVQDKVTGFLVPPRDVGSLAAAMRRFAAMPATARGEMGRAARARVESEYDERLVVASYERLLGDFRVETAHPLR